MRRWFFNLGVLQVFGAMLLVILVMSVSNWMIYRNSISDIYNQMVDHNAKAVQSMIRSFDDSFRAVNHLIYTIHSLPYDNVLDTDGSVDMSKVYTLQQQVESLMSSNDMVEDVIVFYDNVPVAITSRGTSSLRHLFEQKYRHPVYDSQSWLKFLRSKHDMQVFPAENFTILTGSTQEYLMKKLMVITGGNRMALSNKNIVVLIDVDKLLAQVNRVSLIPGASLVVMDQNRQVLMGTGANWDLVEVINTFKGNVRDETSLTRENYEYHVYQSDYNGFIYIHRVPYQFQNLESVTRANRSIILTSIASALILSALLSVYLHRPVRNILRLLGGGSSKGNDFRKIYSGIVKLQTENQQYRSRQQFLDSELRRAVFLRALEEPPHSEEELREMETCKPDLLPHRYFVMGALLLERPAADGDTVPAGTLSAVLQRELRNVRPDAVVVHVRALRFLALFPLRETGERPTLLRRLREAVSAMEQGALEGWRIRGCLSKAYGADFRHFPEAYEEVREGMYNRPVNAEEAILDAAGRADRRGMHLPLDQLEKLSNCLIGGKHEETAAIIRDILQRNAGQNIGLRRMEHVARTLFYHMFRLAEASGLDGDALEALERRFHRALEEEGDIGRAERILIEAAGHIGSRIRAVKPDRLNPAFISQYIELHYMEDLYLDHMAEVLGTTPKYFSNYFKKTFGVTFVDYLSKVRLAHARELLRNTTLSIAEVGERVGYLNASTFATTFKKYYGISPSDFRKQELGA
ncbi:MAG: hypothetical protein A9Z00_02570 [Thermobacillus sp. ZCTH02-B1]|uniref:helix-turn-helix transcriptional regulator n=1 Tax=Thermobacillus sp. ZCTH02-B1 TaxID=1858795 RepID=UPI000B5575A7|nr:helix-turn-helix domain-containing protein [Thermobacillus sp. ZCTH02-B1]OUM93820.1 MAG: hypothetical protein A9Z00_02570 [Thermobacillus sp. ZCTH02-B1]